MALSPKTLVVRAHCVTEAYWLADRAGAVHYGQIRPIDYNYHEALDRAGKWTQDCSGTVTAIHKQAGNPFDPNGLKYNGYGNTTSLRDHLAHVARSEARRGDFVTFGLPSGQTFHVVMLVQSGRTYADPLIFSHGTEGGPFIYPLSTAVRYHQSIGHGTLTFLKSVGDQLR